MGGVKNDEGCKCFLKCTTSGASEDTKVATSDIFSNYTTIKYELKLCVFRCKQNFSALLSLPYIYQNGHNRGLKRRRIEVHHLTVKKSHICGCISIHYLVSCVIALSLWIVQFFPLQSRGDNGFSWCRRWCSLSILWQNILAGYKARVTNVSSCCVAVSESNLRSHRLWRTWNKS